MVSESEGDGVGDYNFTLESVILVITLQLNDSSGFLSTQFRLYAPDGSLVIEVPPPIGGGGQAALEDFELEDTGTYTIMVSESEGDGVGDYNFTLESVNNPGDSTPISYGESIGGSLEVPTDLDHYTFEGTAGDIITLQLNDSSGFLSTQFRLYAPDGSLVIEVPPPIGGGGQAALEDFELEDTGTYTIMVSESEGDGVGDYNFTLESVNNPGDSTPISYGESIGGSLEVPTDLDHYTFEGTAGDIITLQLNDSSGFLSTQFRLYAPDGSLVIEVPPPIGGGGQAALEDFELEDTGTYTIMVSESEGDGVGDYNFTLESVNNPGDSTPISYGESVGSSLEVPTDLDHYAFEGTVGDVITLQLTDSSIFLSAQFRLYTPDGSVFEVAPPLGGNGQALLENFELQDTGTYNIMVSESEGDGTGDYTLSLDQTFDPPGNTPPIVLNPISDKITDEDALFEFTFPEDTFTDADGDPLTYEATSLPDWLTFDDEARMFSGTPENDDVATISITVTANDGNGGSASTTFNLTVNNTNDAPTLETELPDQTAIVDQLFTFAIPENTYFQDVDIVTDPSHSLTLEAFLEEGTALPSWLEFNSSSLNGTPTADDIGTLLIEVVATDNEGATVSDIFELQILPNDTILGTDDDDFLEGTPDDDTIDGLAGDDQIFGHWGDDDLLGGLGNDEIFGNWGDDRLRGNAGNDHLYGNWGDDLLEGGLGNDELKGGPGNDRFILQTDSGLDTILDYQDGRDHIFLDDGLTFGQLSVTQQGDQVLLSIAATNEQLALINQTTVSQIDSSDFILV